jgi:hypothetical protein
MKIQLSNLSKELLKFHRELLQYQTELAEKSDTIKYTSYDLLKLSMTDTRFAWLKKFSELIIQIDIICDDKKNTPFDGLALLDQAKNLINLSHPDNEDLKKALRSETSLMLSLGLLRKAISDFKI